LEDNEQPPSAVGSGGEPLPQVGADGPTLSPTEEHTRLLPSSYRLLRCGGERNASDLPRRRIGWSPGGSTGRVRACLSHQAHCCSQLSAWRFKAFHKAALSHQRSAVTLPEFPCIDCWTAPRSWTSERSQGTQLPSDDRVARLGPMRLCQGLPGARHEANPALGGHWKSSQASKQTRFLLCPLPVFFSLPQ